MTSTIGEDELTGIYEFAIQLGKDAGQMLLDGMVARMSGGAALASAEKDSSVDIVTKTDEGRQSRLLIFTPSITVLLVRFSYTAPFDSV